MKNENSYDDPFYDLDCLHFAPIPREPLPAEFRDLDLNAPREHARHKVRSHRLWLGLLAVAENSPLMGILAIRTGR